jgi:hypothetical protein
VQAGAAGPLLRGLLPRVPRLGQQSPPGRDERGHERLQQPPKGDAAVGLHGDDRAVDGGKRETRELVGRGAVWVVAERERDLCPQPPQCLPAHPADDLLDLPVTRGGRLRGENDQQAQKVGMTFERSPGCE